MHSIGYINKQPGRVAALAAMLVLGAAFAFQFAGYHPCEMCWWQRYPYMAIIALIVAAMFIGRENSRPVVLLAGLLYLADAGLAGFHVGVEQDWWQGPATCSHGADITGSALDALNAIVNAPLVRCDDIAWSLFGISMAGYNFIIALVMGLYCVSSKSR